MSIWCPISCSGFVRKIPHWTRESTDFLKEINIDVQVKRDIQKQNINGKLYDKTNDENTNHKDNDMLRAHYFVKYYKIMSIYINIYYKNIYKYNTNIWTKC